MTAREFSEEVVSRVEHPEGATLDPFTLAILLAVVESVVSYFVSRCLHRADPKDIRSPGLWQRYQLRRRINRAFDDEGAWCNRDLEDMRVRYGARLHGAILATLAARDEHATAAVMADLAGEPR